MIKHSFIHLRFMLMALILVLIFPFNGYTQDLQQDLQQELESAMRATRQAIDLKDHKAFIKSIDPTRRDKQMSEESFISALKDSDTSLMFQRVIPNLTKESIFITLIEKENDWVAYYAETNLEAENHLTLSVFVFHKVNEQWYYAGISNSFVKARPESLYAEKGHDAWKGMDHILWTLRNHPDLQLENLIREN